MNVVRTDKARRWQVVMWAGIMALTIFLALRDYDAFQVGVYGDDAVYAVLCLAALVLWLTPAGREDLMPVRYLTQRSSPLYLVAGDASARSSPEPLLPGSLPLTMAGLRLGMGRAVKGMINGEMFIAVFGLAGLLRKYAGPFDAEKVFAILGVVVGIALVCCFAVRSIERRVTRWMEPRP